MAREIDLENALGFLFRRLNSLANAIFASMTGQSELTGMQAGVLLMLYQSELISLRELARRMHIDRSTIQEIVNRLVSRGLVGRRVSRDDRRTYELWLTPKGTEVVLEHAFAMSNLQEELLKGVNSERGKVALDVLREILELHGY